MSTHLPTLQRSQATVLALWSFGMVLARSCGITSVAALLAPLLGAKENTVRQRLREWCYDADDKRGKQRHELDVTTCFAPLLRWVLAWWPADERRLVLVMDASTLGQRFTVLAISVVYRGCAIPVAWTIVAATRKGAWRPHWEALFDHLDGSVPPDWTVLVLADRGLYARWLFQHIVKRGWHPFLRLNLGGNVRPDGAATFRPLATLVPHIGSTWCGRVTCFSSPESQVACTLLARWDDGYAEPWLIATDLAPEVAEAAWYGMRSWIESGFKDMKRGGWQWHQTKMTDPARAARLWLALAVATLWVVSVGGEADATLPASSVAALPERHVARRRARGRARPRLLSCFRRGVLTILAAVLQAQPLPLGRFLPEPWPTEPPGVLILPPVRLALPQVAPCQTYP
ncbi:MAG: transposase [Chloroflexota bacterium]|nr:transposase [Chloroflexota bacterium]